jgi:uncharacterized protein (DUF952 family)/lysophospholipase L1-like esterase
VSTRYVALGDSQTEGLLDPDGRGGHRGWADRFAEHVAGRDPHLQYANLAVRGLRVGQIRETQLAPALALDPDLATVMGGLNDVLRPSFDLDAVLGDLDTMCGALRIAGATVLTNTFPDVAKIAPLFARLGSRLDALNDGIRAVAAAHGVLLVDVAHHGAGTDQRIWSPDRIHANAIGHSLIAAAFADTLGLPGFENWSDPLPVAVGSGRLRRTAVEARWVAGTVTPWLGRRVLGRSSGDGRSAKRPQLRPVATLFHLCAPQEWPAHGTYQPSSLRDKGFVHLSFADQMIGSAERHFASAPRLVAVEVDPAAFATPIVVEDSYGSGTAFPHAYGPIPVAAATSITELHRAPDGGWQRPS